MTLGSYVQLKVPGNRRSDRFAYGMVVALEQYTDFAATNQYVYVQWIDSDGRPADDPSRHFSAELEPYSA